MSQGVKVRILSPAKGILYFMGWYKQQIEKKKERKEKELSAMEIRRGDFNTLCKRIKLNFNGSKDWEFGKETSAFCISTCPFCLVSFGEDKDKTIRCGYHAGLQNPQNIKEYKKSLWKIRNADGLV